MPFVWQVIKTTFLSLFTVGITILLQESDFPFTAAIFKIKERYLPVGAI